MGITGPGRPFERARRSISLATVAILLAAAGCAGSSAEDGSASPGDDGSTRSTAPDASADEPVDDTTPESAAGQPKADKDEETADEPVERSDGEVEDEPAGDDPVDGVTADEVATPDQLRRWLGADLLVARRRAAPAVASSDAGDLELADAFPTVKAGYLFDNGSLIDHAGDAACPGFELLGDFHVIANIEPNPGDRPAIIVEDRRALATDAGSGTATIPRWRFDCAIGTATDLDPTTEVTYLGDGLQVTKTLAGGLELVETWGLGDTPLALTTGSGTALLTPDQLTYGYVVSPDQTTIYATAYGDTGAASPPAAVLAIEVATGEVRWRRDVGGFVWALDDRVLIEVVEARPETPGDPAGSEIVLVDPATGEDLDRIRFTDRIVGLS